MSRPTRNSARSVATIWPIIGKDPYTGVAYGSPYTVRVSFTKGSSRQYNDAQGTAYIPKSIYWYELDESIGLPSLNEYIALGDHKLQSSPQSVDGAETIKNRTRQDCSMLNDIDDVMVLT